jgi:transposase
MSMGSAPRRLWTAAEKLRIVDEARQPGATMAEVARRHGVRGEDLYVWRRDAREGCLADDIGLPRFVPVVVTDAPLATESPQQPEAEATSMVLSLREGDSLKFDARIDPALLARVLGVLAP